MRLNHTPWRWYTIGLLVVAWRIGITVISALSILLLPYQPAFPYNVDAVLPNYGSRIITTWAQFDGVHYLTIISRGYFGVGLIQAFFPLYPLLVRYLRLGFLNPIVVGIILSTLCFGTALWILYRLICLDEPEPVAKRSIYLALLMPTAFFFTALYTEGLFFLLIVGSFYAARKGKWWLAGLLGALSAATRLVGIFMIPALLYEFWLQHKTVLKFNAVTTLLPAVSLAGYMVYLKNRYNDALLFYHAQGDFGTSRETKRIILLYQVFYRYTKMFLTVPITSTLFYTVTQEFFAGLFGFIGLIVGWFVTRPSYIVFGFLAYLLPTLTGTFSSLPRYLLPIFPIYIVCGKLFPDKLYTITLIVSAILLIINIIIFTQGLWVA